MILHMMIFFLAIAAITFGIFVNVCGYSGKLRYVLTQISRLSQYTSYILAPVGGIMTGLGGDPGVWMWCCAGTHVCFRVYMHSPMFSQNAIHVGMVLEIVCWTWLIAYILACLFSWV